MSVTLLQKFEHHLEKMAPFETAPTIAVAVSGGADSMALCLLLQKWTKKNNAKIIALTVDHHLRPDSTDEAQQVKNWMQDLGIKHHILNWHPPENQNNIMEAARNARYHLLEEFCAAHHILHLATGHHADDQSETFLNRLTRGSGLYGLAGMGAVTYRDHIRMLRPLLSMSKQDLKDFLTHQNQTWIEDPTNNNPDYQRTRWRQSRDILSAEGLSPQRLNDTITNLGRARAAAEYQLAEAALKTITFHEAGFVTINTKSFLQLPPEIGLRLLAQILRHVGRPDHTPRMESLMDLYDHLKIENFPPRTLKGAYVFMKNHAIIICREWQKTTPILWEKNMSHTRWDSRFDLTRTTMDQQWEIGALGEPGWEQIKPHIQTTLPHPVCLGLPTVRHQKKIVAIPHLQYADKEIKITFHPDFPVAGAVFS